MAYLTPYRRPIRRQNVYTFQDAFVRVLDAMTISSVGRHGRLARQAVQECWIELAALHDWTYFHRASGFSTVAAYGEGTVAYTHSSRTLTLSGGTWPSDILQRSIEISNRRYTAESVTSSTVLVLPERWNPGADIASGASYQARKAEYLIDVEFSRIGVLRSANTVMPCYKTPSELEELKTYLTGGTALYYTIRGSSNVIGAYVVDFCPEPTDVNFYQFSYLAKQRPLRTWSVNGDARCEYSEGTVSVSGTTVTGTGTAFTADMVGCVFRLTGSASTVPTGLVGGPGYEGNEVDNPYAEYRMVQSVTDADTLVLDEAPTGTYSAVRYTIGDPVDLSEELWLLLLRMAERKYCEQVPIMERLSMKQSQYQRAETDARIMDGKSSRGDRQGWLPSIQTIMDNSPLVEP